MNPIIIPVVFLLCLAALIIWAVKASKELPKSDDRKPLHKLSRRELKRMQRR